MDSCEKTIYVYDTDISEACAVTALRVIEGGAAARAARFLPRLLLLIKITVRLAGAGGVLLLLGQALKLTASFVPDPLPWIAVFPITGVLIIAASLLLRYFLTTDDI